MHSDLMRETVFHDLNHLYPGRITNKTNGITFRRWLMLANPKLTDLLRETCGEAVLDDPTQLSLIETRASDVEFQKKFRSVKLHNKTALARLIGERLGIKVDPTALFDVQIKRIHEYKRQLLNIIETVALYQAMKDDPNGNWVPRVKIFAGKAAASYRYAKLIIKLVNDVADVVNNDPAIGGKLKVVFLPDYNVSLAEVIIPAADLSEQISTAGMEASGTGNMKLAMNGALTIGTLDGANVEIQAEVGPENIFIFGLTADEIQALRDGGCYRPRDLYEQNPSVRRIIDALDSGLFCPEEPGLFRWITRAVLDAGDVYFHLADLTAYIETQDRVGGEFEHAAAWASKAILNVARIGRFSSDRTVREYAREIWKIGPVEG